MKIINPGEVLFRYIPSFSFVKNKKCRENVFNLKKKPGNDTQKEGSRKTGERCKNIVKCNRTSVKMSIW